MYCWSSQSICVSRPQDGSPIVRTDEGGVLWIVGGWEALSGGGGGGGTVGIWNVFVAVIII